MKNLTLFRKNVIALCLCLAMLAATLILYAFPVNITGVTVLTKTSNNTFVGDEKYVKALTQVQETAALYENAEIRETVTESINNKGVATSKVAFEVYVPSARLTGYELIGYGLRSSFVLAGLLACEVIAAVLLALTLRRETLETEHRRLPKGVLTLRKAAAWLCLIALVLAVVFPFAANLDFSRAPELLKKAGNEAMEAQADLLEKYREIHASVIGEEDLSKFLHRMDNELPATWWVMLAVLFTALMGYVLLAKGEVKTALTRGALYLFVIVLCIVVLYPFFVMFITGFRSNAETTDMNFTHLLPTEWIWSNIPDIINRNVPTFLLNSILLSTGATLIAMLCGIPAAYAMARMNFRGKKAFLGFVIMSQMFSPVVLLVGISQLMNSLRLDDSIIGLMLINAAFNQAFAIWLLRGTFVAISPEMEQAACIDGCNSVSALVRILLPMAAPGIVTTLIFVFINAWNEYTISTILIRTPENKPITVGITQFSSYNMIEWHYLFAAALIATIPVVILFMCIEKHLVSGLTSGGVKG